MYFRAIAISLILYWKCIDSKRPNASFYRQHRCEEENNLKGVVKEIVEEMSSRVKCMVFITDSRHRNTITSVTHVKDISSLLKYEIVLRDNEEFFQTRKKYERTLLTSKLAGCHAYVVLIANGLLASRFLKYAERERLINTRGPFLLLHDHRLFRPEMRYLWNRIVDVVFIRQYNAYKRRSGQRGYKERIDLETISYSPRKRPSRVTKYIDSWYRGKLRYGVDHFMQKIGNLKQKTLRIAIFEHIPAVTQKSRSYYTTKLDSNAEALGIEFELMHIIAKAMNFKPKYYMPHNIDKERWGSEKENETYTGLLAEANNGKASFYLGDLHYTLHHLNYFDFTIPYNTECLTFLTPESLTENSWKLLILPFTLQTWIALLLTLFTGSGVCYALSLFYKRKISLYKGMSKGVGLLSNVDTKGLYLFTKMQNSMLYVYAMLLQVSLPRLPNPWAVRILIGWWWIYSILIAVAYRASMTASLANPTARVTIDTLKELAKSSIPVGAWSKHNKDFFLMSSDPYSQQIANKFRLIEDEDESIARVANGSFCYYENIYLLKHARVKRQVLEDEGRKNKTKHVPGSSMKFNLHIMEECVVNMPIAIGLEKNSPLKPYVDFWVRRIIEAGLVEKWLSDVMEWSKITEIRQETDSEKALINLRKLYGAMVILGIGYFLSITALIGEILYWKFIVIKHPTYDKYHMDIFYDQTGKSKT